MGDDSSYFRKLGPVGWDGGSTWDENGNTKVAQIFLSHDGEDIRSIQFQYYAENGTLVLSNIYGSQSSTNFNFDAVRLNYPTEYITGINACQNTNNLNIRSITFSTNLGEYGPFGPSKPTTSIKEFSIKLGKDRQFGGFHGTHVGSLYSIGLYLKPIMNLQYSPKGNFIELTEDGEH